MATPIENTASETSARRHKPIGLSGRADQLIALASGGAELESAMSLLLGLEKVPKPVVEIVVEAVASGPSNDTAVGDDAREVVPPYLRPAIFTSLQAEVPKPEVAVERGGEIAARESEFMPPEIQPLGTRAEVLTRLRASGMFRTAGSELDVESIVGEISDGKVLHRLPRLMRKTWAGRVTVVIDRSRRLAPYWLDQDLVVRWLSRVMAFDDLTVAWIDEGTDAPMLRGSRVPSDPGPEGGVLLMLGDLGLLESESPEVRDAHLEWGLRCREAGAIPVALLPCRLTHVDAELARVWKPVPWESLPSTGELDALVGAETDLLELLVVSLSCAVRVEPGILRRIRRSTGLGRRDAGYESLFWSHPAVAGKNCMAADFDPREIASRRSALSRVPVEIQSLASGVIQSYRGKDLTWIKHVEMLAMETVCRPGAVDERELASARAWAKKVSQDLKDRDDLELAGWFLDVLRRNAGVLRGSVGKELRSIAANFVSRHFPDAELPSALGPRDFQPRFENPVLFELRQRGDRIVARRAAECVTGKQDPRDGSFLTHIRSRNGEFKITAEDRSDRAFWSTGEPPAWAHEWGWDQFGAWVTFQVGGVVQRMRWIPPGSFLMGSPDDEEGRFEDEGPRHEKTIERGFWMFDTPCTQELWTAVMGENPSHFRGEKNPVEMVSWNDGQRFIAALRARLPGLEIALPDEAQWEYACRAGTQDARYGNLNEIAWYGENSSGTTHSVAKKAPNAWGLHDTLGNVWEWTESLWTERLGQKPDRGQAGRVIRGGSWVDDPRLVRAACRDWYHPELRSADFGFRCSEFSGNGLVGRGAGGARAESGSERGAEHRADRDAASAPAWIHADRPGRDTVTIAQIEPLRVVSDLEEIGLGAITRPAWASAMGRDAFGLWAEITVKAARMKLRWIPPGEFWMGSPESDPHAFDDEKPQRLIRFRQGFWMFATPCTQAFWQAVMEKNPSRFQSPTRPVEQVSWEDCKAFVTKLNGELSGLSLALPTEAQWEYACRAGTLTSTYAGNVELLGTNNAPILDPIAWYAGNCGQGFELKNGWDISEWDEKQYKDRKGGTHPVAQKLANPWGLHDMLGNVWEWCEDEYRAERVIRGGSWSNDPRDVRAAYRNWHHPGNRHDSIGFRCSEFSGVELVQGEAAGGSERGAEHRDDGQRPSRRSETGPSEGLN